MRSVSPSGQVGPAALWELGQILASTIALYSSKGRGRGNPARRLKDAFHRCRILLVLRARISCECRLLFGSSYGIMDIPDCVNCGRACKGWPLEPETDKLERSQGRCDGRHGLHAASEGGEPFAFAQAQSIADGLSQAQVASVAFKLAARHVVH